MSLFHVLHLVSLAKHLLPPTRDDMHFVSRPAQAQDFREAADPCPACSYSFYQHQFAPLASTWSDDGLEQDILLWKLLDERRWREVMKITPGPKGGGLMAAYAFRCPVNRSAGWFTMFFPVDPGDPPHLTGKEALDPEETWKMVKMLKDLSWRIFE